MRAPCAGSTTGACSRTAELVHEPQSGPCDVAGCELPASARGLCRGHYKRQLKTGNVGDAGIPARTPRGIYGICTVPGCGRPHMAHGMCGTHRRRLRQTGVLGGPIGRSPQPDTCTALGCQQPSHARGLCRHHYDQARKNGPA
jgi:hypothetical protein